LYFIVIIYVNEVPSGWRVWDSLCTRVAAATHLALFCCGCKGVTQKDTCKAHAQAHAHMIKSMYKSWVSVLSIEFVHDVGLC